MKLTWVTDPHLEFCDDHGAFVEALESEASDAVLLGGDISDARHLVDTLSILDRSLSVPIFFVLGNHDYYHGDIDGVRAMVTDLASRSKSLRFLPVQGATPVAKGTVLLGHGGWADGRYGDYERSQVRLNDYVRIRDLSGIDAEKRLVSLQRLGDDAARNIASTLRSIRGQCSRVILLTHVPPFAEAAWHEGKMSDWDFLPHFSCKATGDVILQEAEAEPDRELLVLCGHCHSPGYYHPLPNLHVVTGGATYGHPEIQGTFAADGDLTSFIERFAARA